MYNCKFPNLFTPVKIGDTLFRNRIFSSPTGLQYTHTNNHPMPDGIAYYERKAMGGAASVCVGDAMVDSEIALAIGNHILLDDPSVRPSLTKMAEAITRHGAVASMELSHGGNTAGISYAAGNKIYGPVETDVMTVRGKIHALEMTREIMDRTIRKHAEAADFVKRCGFGMVTLHAGHGWLLHQFMSPVMNTRSDEYGGSFENRMRFPVEVIKAIREAVGPGFPIEARISGSEVYEGGYGLDYGIEIAKTLDGLVDILHVSAGSHEDARVFTVTHPSMFLEDGVNVKYAAEIKKHVSKSLVATVGAISDPAMMEEIVASGKADIVEAARALFCDPYLPTKARTGNDDDITRCIRCFQCYSNLMTHGHIICALNPDISNEADARFARAGAVRKKVLVAGGGIAGMQAALTANKRGHQVVLCEKTGRLGGILLCEEGVPFKRHLHEYLELQARRVSRAAIDVRLNTEVTADFARQLEPDAIIAAVGARPYVPPIEGADKPIVVSAEELYMHPEKAGKRIVILGGGLSGVELAVFMSGLGRKVTVLEMLDDLTFGGNLVHARALAVEIENGKIEVVPGTKAVDITDDGVIGEKRRVLKLFEADTVVTALGMRPLHDKCDELRFCAPEFHQVGDCSSPGNIWKATKMAHFAALSVGMC